MKTKLFLLFLSMSAVIHASDFRYIFGEDYNDALDFLKQNKKVFIETSANYNTDTAIVMAMVFPELIRYSLVRDFLETKALEFLYINGGKNAADFSIGNFQMKPSFIEDLEVITKNNKTLCNKYKIVTVYQSQNPLEIRSERIQRLKSLEWQIIYANCFYDALITIFPELKNKSKTQQILIIATAYNSGFNENLEIIYEQSKNKFFPYGPNFKGEQYAYCDIAVNFYHRYFKLYMNYMNQNTINRN